jgi:hypothetical protein
MVRIAEAIVDSLLIIGRKPTLNTANYQHRHCNIYITGYNMKRETDKQNVFIFRFSAFGAILQNLRLSILYGKGYIGYFQYLK